MSLSSLRLTLKHLGRDSLYLLVGFPLWLAAFTIVITGLSTGAGTLVIGVGFAVLVATLYVAQGFAFVERRFLSLDDERPAAQVVYNDDSSGSLLKRGWTVLTDPQRWFDALAAVAMFPISTITWSFTITWWAGAIAGLSWPIWGWAFPNEGSDSLATLTGWSISPVLEGTTNLAIGLLFAASLPFVTRILATLQQGVSRALLVDRSEQLAQVNRLVEGRSAAHAAEATALRRLERDIHDGPQQRLIRMSMDLGRAKRQAQHSAPELHDTLDGVIAQAQDTLDELRNLSRGIAPPVLVDRGLQAAIEELAARSPIPVDVQLHLGSQPLAPHIESTVYFVVSEALTNVAKHSAATQAIVWVAHRGTDVALRVADNGTGGAMLAKGHGLVGLSDRVRSVDGVLNVVSPVGGPTTIDVEIPCVS